MSLSLIEIAFIIIAFFLLLMFLRMPIGAAMIVSGFVGLVLIRGLPAALSGLGVLTWRNGINYSLIVVPLFTWMGILAAYGGVSRDAFSSLYKWIGHLPGGLAMACSWACAAFGAVSGSHVATAITMSKVILPEMRRYKYADKFSLGCIAASGCLDALIPPSTAFIIYGFVTETAIGPLFIAGILPGILLTIMFCLQIYIQCRANPALGPAGPDVGWKERLISLKDMWSILLIFFIVMGGIYTGFFTPNEAAAVGVFAVLIISIASRQLTWNGFLKSLAESGTVTAMIMILIIGAMVFGAFITTSELPDTAANLVKQLALDRYLVLAAILVFYILAGFIMEIYAVLIVSLPIFFPIVTALGFDPVHFGVLSVVTIMMGAISPPFGVVVFAVQGVNIDVPLYTIFGGALPFLGNMLVGLAILVIFPEISTLLPAMAMPYK